MSKHRDSHLGSQVIHLAASTGNTEIIRTLIEKYGSDIKEQTLGKQTVHHCAA